ncbi:retrotransposon protein, putative, ty1-copia subclass [Tanacetum coccineum]
MKDNQVWILVALPPNGQTVESKWLFKKKTDMDGKVHTFKARMVAKGLYQTYGVDYGETFSLVVDIRAIRILLAIVAYYDYEIWQMDIKTAFLNCHLSEEIIWYNLRVLVMSIDILLNGNKRYMRKKLNLGFKWFSIKDLREAAYIHGIKIIRDRSKRLIALSKSAYLEKTLNKFKMENSKKGYTPMIEKPDYSMSQGAKTPNEVQRLRRVPYASAIGSIKEIHWTAVKTILKYLRNTKDIVLVYGAKPEAELKVSCYADASFQTDKDDTKSQTGYVFVLNGGAVDWKSAKQSTTAMSSTEAEFIVVAKASMEASAIVITDDPKILKGAKHSQRKYRYIREGIQECEIILKKVHTDDNVVDPLTKLMPINKHYEHARAIEIVPASSLM